MARIDTGGTMSGRPLFGGVEQNKLSGTAQYGNTTSSWNTKNPTYIKWTGSEQDPATATVLFETQTRSEAWVNASIGYSTGRYMHGQWISGIKFQWRTNPNVSGGIAFRRYGIGIVSNGGTRNRWSSPDINEWNTDGRWRNVTYNFDGTLLAKLNDGWRFDEFHIMLHSPSHGSTPGSPCYFHIRDFEFIYKSNNSIVPAMRSCSNRTDYPIAS